MGIIQSAVNQSLTGTAFLLNQMRGVKAQKEAVKTQEKAVKAQEEYNETIKNFYDQWGGHKTVKGEDGKDIEVEYDNFPQKNPILAAKQSLGYKTEMLKESKERQKRMMKALKERKIDFTEFGGEGTN